MSALFEQVALEPTAMGELSLRRRFDPGWQRDVFEVKLGDAFLMSSLFTVAEEELARLGLAAVEGDELDVVVGGLGLGYTALAALDDQRVRSVRVVEALEPVIDWHVRGLLPHASALSEDARAHLIHGDFFALTAGDVGFDAAQPGRRFDAVLVDIDHAPDHHLDAGHAGFYTAAGLQPLTRYLAADGVFALWSNDPPDARYLDVLATVFEDADAHEVRFRNPYLGGESSNTVYIAARPTNA